ncbi:hypothetical protein MSAN_01626300 [Mycena sanguinolenta]|uniref:F-box domain-containing protein n=1 Tax=Mycena sanguinolenta TaxID=230812 RepID=A0A8H6Y2B6_9AGAR|nr:hypothetical protein MSAN_01626300 [Mycena sanguinolenta]
MPFLSQELVDAILAEVDDLDSLKACSLVDPRFRVPSQRVLLDRITLSGWSKAGNCHLENYGAARTLLQQSPHIARYITGLKLELHVPLLDTDSLQWVLQQLVNVRQFSLRGSYGPMRWTLHLTHLPSALSEALLDFVSRQHLHRLCVSQVGGIPGEILLTAAPSLSLFHVTLEKGVPDTPRSDVSPIVHDFVLQAGCDYVFPMLKYFRPYLSTLRRVCVYSKQEFIDAILEPAANSLEYIHLVCNDPEGSRLSLPSLRSLRTLECTISSHGQERAELPYLMDDISTLLNSHASPVLVDIVMTFPARERLSTGSMRALDRALVAHPAGPSIRWRMDFKAGDWATRFTRFRERLIMGLPETHALGRLVVEEYRPNREAWYSPS